MEIVFIYGFIDHDDLWIHRIYGNCCHCKKKRKEKGSKREF